jgi:hypothetical protein
MSGITVDAESVKSSRHNSSAELIDFKMNKIPIWRGTVGLSAWLSECMECTSHGAARRGRISHEEWALCTRVHQRQCPLLELFFGNSVVMTSKVAHSLWGLWSLWVGKEWTVTLFAGQKLCAASSYSFRIIGTEVSLSRNWWEQGLDETHWIELAQNMVHWRALLLMNLNFRDAHTIGQSVNKSFDQSAVSVYVFLSAHVRFFNFYIIWCSGSTYFYCRA